MLFLPSRAPPPNQTCHPCRLPSPKPTSCVSHSLDLYGVAVLSPCLPMEMEWEAHARTFARLALSPGEVGIIIPNLLTDPWFGFYQAIFSGSSCGRWEQDTKRGSRVCGLGSFPRRACPPFLIAKYLRGLDEARLRWPLGYSHFATKPEHTVGAHTAACQPREQVPLRIL